MRATTLNGLYMLSGGRNVRCMWSNLRPRTGCAILCTRRLPLRWPFSDPETLLARPAVGGARTGAADGAGAAAGACACACACADDDADAGDGAAAGVGAGAGASRRSSPRDAAGRPLPAACCEPTVPGAATRRFGNTSASTVLGSGRCADPVDAERAVVDTSAVATLPPAGGPLPSPDSERRRLRMPLPPLAPLTRPALPALPPPVPTSVVSPPPPPPPLPSPAGARPGRVALPCWAPAGASSRLSLRPTTCWPPASRPRATSTAPASGDPSPRCRLR